MLATRYTHRILGLRRGLPASLPVELVGASLSWPAVSSILPDDGGLISTQADAQPLGAQTCLLLNRNGYSDAPTPEIPVFKRLRGPHLKYLTDVCWRTRPCSHVEISCETRSLSSRHLPLLKLILPFPANKPCFPSSRECCPAAAFCAEGGRDREDS